MGVVLRLLIVVPLAYVVAIVGAAFTLAYGGVGASPYAPAMFTLAFVLNTVFLGAGAFFPSAIAIAVAEVFAIRSVFYYLAVGGILGFLVGEFVVTAKGVEIFQSTHLLTAAAGFVGGFLYWAIAGAHAGSPRRPEPAPRSLDAHR